MASSNLESRSFWAADVAEVECHIEEATRASEARHLAENFPDWEKSPSLQMIDRYAEFQDCLQKFLQASLDDLHCQARLHELSWQVELAYGHLSGRGSLLRTFYPELVQAYDGAIELARRVSEHLDYRYSGADFEESLMASFIQYSRVIVDGFFADRSRAGGAGLGPEAIDGRKATPSL